MERKESKNGLELVKYGAIRLKGNFSALFMGAFAMVTPLVLVILVPMIISMLTGISWIVSIGVALFALFLGPLQMGYIKYFNAVIDRQQPKLWEVYSYIRFSVVTLRSIYISILLLLMYLIGGVLWIVPAGFAISFYSMSLFFYEKFKNERLTRAMHECSKHMIGNRLAMFSYKLIFYLVYAMLFVVGALCIGLVYILLAESVLVSWVVAVCSTIIFIFLYTMITVYYHSCNQIFFEDTLMYHERKRTKKVTHVHVEEKKEEIDKDNIEKNAVQKETTKKKEVPEKKESTKTKKTISKSKKAKE